jgi:predicted permease
MVLTLTAGAIGVWLAATGLRVLVKLAPGTIPRLDQVHLRGASILFDIAVVLTVGLVFASFPLLRRRIRFEPLREAGRGLTTSRAQLRVRSVLVTAQIALALVLLSAAGLMLRSFQQTLHVQSGADAENVLAIDVSMPFSRYGTFDKAAQFWQQLEQRVSALPGVARASAITSVPFASSSLGCAVMWVDPPRGDGERGTGCVPYSITAPGYFETMGIKVQGRTLTWTDLQNKTGAIVVSKSLAQRLWPNDDPIGKGIRGYNNGDVYFRVVGVTGDVRIEGLQKPPSEMVYYPLAPILGTQLWQPATAMTVLVKSRSGSPEQLTASVRRILSEMDPFAAIGTVSTMESVLASSMARLSFTMILLGIAGFMALVLSVVGLYGVIAYLVSRRRSEIGIRMALGADRRNVGSMVVRQSMQLGVTGVTIGLVGAALTMRLLTSLLYEVKPTDPLTLASVSLFLLAVCAAASLLPARRAASVSPVEVLRGE